MGKKITEQNADTAQQQNADGAAGGNGAATPGQQSVEDLLEADADGVDDGADGTDGDGDNDGDDSNDVAALVRKALAEFLPTIHDQTTREIDRRVNSALKKVRSTSKPNDEDDDADEGDKGAKAPRKAAADVRGARIAFREYLPEKIRFLSPEEKAMATEFGLVQINAAAAKGFDDEDDAGREAAEATVAFLKKARSYYSGRTKKALEKQGAIRKDGTGQTSYSTTPPGSTQTAFDRAEKKNRELFPERYAHEKK